MLTSRFASNHQLGQQANHASFLKIKRGGAGGVTGNIAWVSKVEHLIDRVVSVVIMYELVISFSFIRGRQFSSFK